MDQSLINLVSNVISSKVRERFSLRENEILLFTSILGIVFLNYLRIFYFCIENWYYILPILGLAGVTLYEKQKTFSSTLVEDLYSFKQIHNFRNLHPEFFDSNIPTFQEYYTGFILPEIGTKMFFTDQIHKVKGYITVSIYTRPTESKEGKNARGFTFHANESFCSYIEKLENTIRLRLRKFRIRICSLLSR